MLIQIVAVVLIVVIGVNSLRNPLVRRIGIRNAVRRPREAALVMLGCILGTALIVGNASVGDSYAASIRNQALGDYGELDAIVSYDSQEDWAAANAHLAATRVAGVRTATAVATLTVPITTVRADVTSPRSNLIEANYARAGSLGATPGSPSGTGPPTGTAWASRNLADTLHLRIGDTLTLHTPTGMRLRVGKIVSNPLVSFLDGNLRPAAGVLVPVGTIATLQQQDPSAVIPQWRTLVVGEQPHEVAAPDPVKVESLRKSLTGAATPFNGDVEMSRSDILKAAVAAGKSSASFLTTIGAFGIIAGILLLVNVLLMLAEERLAEMGTMRAVGLSRWPLIGAFSLEGAAYSLVGSVLGGGFGLVLGRLLVRIMDQRTNTPSPDWGRGLRIVFTVSGATVATGIAAGFVVSVLAVVGTSYRVSRLDVIRSLRGLPDQSHHRRHAATPLLIVGVLVGALLGLFGYTAPSALPFLFGPVIALVCLGVLLSRRFGSEAGTAVAALPIVSFAIMFSVLNRERATGPSGAVLSGVVAVAAGVFLINVLQARIAVGLRRIGRGRGAVPTRLGLANPIAHRVRMLLTVGPFALVIFTLSYAEGLAHLVSSELGRTAPIIGGSYAVFADSSAVHPFDYAHANIGAIKHVAGLGTNYGSFNFAPDKKPKIWPVTGFDKHLTDVAPPPLLRRDKKYKTDKAAYDAVAKDPDLILVTQGFLMSGSFGPAPDDPEEPADIGSTYTFINPVTNQARDVVVAGIRRDDIFAQGAFYGAKGMQAIFGKQFVMSDAMLAVDGARADTIRRLEHAGIDNGVQARDITETARTQFSEAIKIVNLFRSDLGIGIIVGIAGIGVVLVRSVRDRRHQIGTLRAMGFDAREIGQSFLVEGAFVAIQGLLVGAGFGVLTVLAVSKAELVRTLIGFTPPLRFPPISIGVISAGLFVAALAACVAPARSASKIPPAVALRLVD